MEERGRERGRRRVVVLVVGGVLGAVVLAALGWLLYYRSTYGTFAWWQIPPRIHYCGRDYLRGTTAAAGSLPARGDAIVQVTTIEPAGRAVYAERPADGAAAGAGTSVAGEPCAMGLLVKQNDSYVQFGLSGGP